ncbi:hypothetical protein [Culicoidibacter larvae]|uniref:Uncharacterized protein n=1 Tax=Culicoidibacter larvae TaxID=2579976 RepID=A0A5R8Q8Y3_9FIRM|nr:hypothetical protein [Culicoidibacter larvae]TLG71769.1 hypothetical protein FEZ08_10195 [Culicoidibacter larvae]
MMKWLVRITLAVLLVTAGFGMKVTAYNEPNQYASEQEAREQELKNLQEKHVQPGTYPIEVSYTQNGKTINKTIYLTVRGEHTVIVDDIAIDAHSIVINLNQVAAMNKAGWIEAANARAWNINTLAEVPVTQVNSSQVKEAVGSYPLYFATDAFVKTSVTVTVVDGTDANQSFANWFAQHDPGEGFSWYGFLHIHPYLLSLLLVLILLIPFIIIAVYYLITSKLVRDIIRSIIK